MSDHTLIEWTDATWNPITGCSVISPGCKNCYAMKLAGTRLQHHASRAGLTQQSATGPVWNGQLRFNMAWLDQPLRWRRPRKVFVCAHGDLFHESAPDLWIADVFGVMHAAPWHTFQVLTKRADRMRALLTDPKFIDKVEESAALHTHAEVVWPLPNVWLGVSTEDQQRANERVPHLLSTPAAVRWISAEPLLGPVDLRLIDLPQGALPNGITLVNHPCELDALAGLTVTDLGFEFKTRQRIDWVVAGGESGQAARPMHPEWVRSLRDQCVETGVAFHFKQWGEWTPGENVERVRGTVDTAFLDDDAWRVYPLNLATDHGHIDDQPDLYKVGKKSAGRHLDGRTHDEWPKAAA